jgi:hypothetical protein
VIKMTGISVRSLVRKANADMMRAACRSAFLAAVVGIGGLVQDVAAERGGGHVQRVRCRPGGVGGSGPVRAELSGGLGGDPRGVVPPGAAFGGGQQVAERRAGRAGPPLAQLRPGQIGGELAASVPHRPAVFPRVTGQGDGVSGDLARVPGAVPDADQHPGLVQAGEELLPAGRGRGGGGDGNVASQGDAGDLVQAAPGRFLVLPRLG